ncbi:MAG: hypothetical protein GX951_04735 [Mollicutes bacterium]|nr:hypothetical protein [Mollicutes bacterium]
MKKCYNCSKVNKDTDNYCRNCGYILKNKKYYITLGVMVISMIVILAILILLIILSFIKI